MHKNRISNMVMVKISSMEPVFNLHSFKKLSYREIKTDNKILDTIVDLILFHLLHVGT